MRAVVQREFGGPDVLVIEDVADPEPGEQQVRVAIAASGVHRIDTVIRSGGGGGPFPLPELPTTPGREVAGIVDALGPDVDVAWLGRRVVASLGPAGGGYAQQAVVDVGALHAVPDDASFVDAVAAVGTGRTSRLVLDVADLHDDDVVIVTAAAGGLGSLLVQASRAAGSTVIGLAGGPDKVAIVGELGADAAFDYTDEQWPEHVRTWLDGCSATVALDGVGGDIGAQVLDLIGDGGRMIVFGASSGGPMTTAPRDPDRSPVEVRPVVGPGAVLSPERLVALTKEALDELAAGHLTPLVYPPFPLERADEAHRAIESRATVGKVVLQP